MIREPLNFVVDKRQSLRRPRSIVWIGQGHRPPAKTVSSPRRGSLRLARKTALVTAAGKVQAVLPQRDLQPNAPMFRRLTSMPTHWQT